MPRVEMHGVLPQPAWHLGWELTERRAAASNANGTVQTPSHSLFVTAQLAWQHHTGTTYQKHMCMLLDFGRWFCPNCEIVRSHLVCSVGLIVFWFELSKGNNGPGASGIGDDLLVPLPLVA